MSKGSGGGGRSGRGGGGGAGQSFEQFTEDYINSSKYADKYRANPNLVNHQALEGKWTESLRKEAEAGPLSPSAIKSFKDRYGETVLLQTFRGVTGKGLSKYTPENKKMAHQQNPMMF